jgi:DNA-binding transcriptional LysR family regulator
MVDNGTEPLWDDLRVLLALQRYRSFLAAGRALGVSTSTAARRIEALEQALGRPLVHRSSAGTLVEPDAAALLTLAEQMEAGLAALRRDATEDVVRGTTRVSVGEGFARPVTAVLASLRARHPGLEVELVVETRLANLARREADFGIRHARASSSVLVERPVGKLRFGLYASQGYVERRIRGGRVLGADLGRHDWVGYEGTPTRLPQHTWLLERGVKRLVFRTSSDHALLEAVVQGQGLGLLGEPFAKGAGLVRLETDVALPSLSVLLVFHRDLRRSAQHRVVARALESALRRGLA